MAVTKEDDATPRILNRRAKHEFTVLEKVEAGIVLMGTEVKSLRDGQGQLDDAFARVENGEMWMYGSHVPPYLPATLHNNHEPKRPRKLLLHRREIRRLGAAAEERGATLVPLRIHWRRGYAKVELALCLGKSKADKREDLKRQQDQRDIQRAYAANNR